MKKSRLVLAIGCLVVSMLALVVYAAPGEHLRSFLHGPGGWGGHGGMHGGMHNAMAGFVAELDLRPDQQVHIDTIHETLSGRVQAHRGGMGAHLEVLIGRIEEGSMNTPEAHLHIDERIETFRSTAYLVSDELIALIHSLDDEQRTKLTEHLGQLQVHLQHMEKMGFLNHGTSHD